jgi:hypothetical protein
MEKIIGIRKYLLIIDLNVNGLNSPINRHRLLDRIKKKSNPGWQSCSISSKYKALSSNPITAK